MNRLALQPTQGLEVGKAIRAAVGPTLLLPPKKGCLRSLKVAADAPTIPGFKRETAERLWIFLFMLAGFSRSAAHKPVAANTR
jgi:hypothetical protein